MKIHFVIISALMIALFSCSHQASRKSASMEGVVENEIQSPTADEEDKRVQIDRTKPRPLCVLKMPDSSKYGNTKDAMSVSYLILTTSAAQPALAPGIIIPVATTTTLFIDDSKDARIFKSKNQMAMIVNDALNGDGLALRNFYSKFKKKKGNYSFDDVKNAIHDNSGALCGRTEKEAIEIIQFYFEARNPN